MPDIRYGDAISISVGDAVVLVEVIGVFEKLLARRNGQPLSPLILAMRSDLKECIARAAANADVSAKAVMAQEVLSFEKDVNSAAEALGITPGGVRWACREGRLGRKIGRQWLISDEEIEMYRRTYQRGVA